MSSILDLMQRGGPFMWPILFVGLAAHAVVAWQLIDPRRDLRWLIGCGVLLAMLLGLSGTSFGAIESFRGVASGWEPGEYSWEKALAKWLTVCLYTSYFGFAVAALLSALGGVAAFLRQGPK